MRICDSSLPLQLFRSGQLLCLSATDKVGLIIQQPHYSDFVGLGGAIGGSFDIRCTSIYPIGKVHFAVPETYRHRQRAFQNRLVYMEALHKITFVHSPLQRAYLIVRQLSLWLGQEQAMTIPYELVAQLVGILPGTVKLGWHQYQQCHLYQNCPTMPP